MGSDIYRSCYELRVRPRERGKASRETVFGKKRGANRGKVGGCGSFMAFGTLFNSWLSFGDVDLKLRNDLVGELPPVRRTKRGQVLNL